MAEITDLLAAFVSKVKNDPGLSDLFRDALHELEAALSPPAEQPVEAAPTEPVAPVEGEAAPVAPPPAEAPADPPAPEPPVAPGG